MLLGGVALAEGGGYAALGPARGAVVQAGSTAVVKALEGWSFDGPKGKEQIRAADHALLQPMFTARLKGTGSAAEPELVDSVLMTTVAPPMKKAAG
ncbi:hypothetical protein ACWEWX_30445 [Streptomyces asiaticus]